jgi:hypothetical protein
MPWSRRPESGKLKLKIEPVPGASFSPINHNGSRFIEIGVVNLAKVLVF